jgi:hypothetical protein
MGALGSRITFLIGRELSDIFGVAVASGEDA